MAMPPPMVPAPMTAAERISRVGVSLGTSGILIHFALGEKELDHGTGLGGEHAAGEDFDFAFGAGVETELDAGLNGVYRGVGSMSAARRFLEIVAGLRAGGNGRGKIGELRGLIA